MAPRTDITPFRDPRNVVGLLTDVLDLALRGPVLAKPPPEPTAVNPAVRSRDLGREFTKAPRTVLNGYKRKGSSDLYQRVKSAYEKLPEDLWGWDARKRELHATLRSLSGRVLEIIMKVMEDLDSWEPFTKPTTQRRYGKVETIDPEWPRQWHDHVSSAIRLGVDLATIMDIEVAWRWRDLTDRSHRGKNVKAAFEAAWLAGQYKFAQQLIDQEFA
jgi:hypothetical protein